MQYFEINTWYRIPDGERLILNTNWFCGSNRFVIRVSHPVRLLLDDVSKFNDAVPKDSFRSMICGDGYAWSEASLYAVSYFDDDVAVAFQLTFC